MEPFYNDNSFQDKIYVQKNRRSLTKICLLTCNAILNLLGIIFIILLVVVVVRSKFIRNTEIDITKIYEQTEDYLTSIIPNQFHFYKELINGQALIFDNTLSNISNLTKKIDIILDKSNIDHKLDILIHNANIITKKVQQLNINEIQSNINSMALSLEKIAKRIGAGN
jgi:hypothetical protein